VRTLNYLLALCAMATSLHVAAQEWPSKPIKIVTPSPAGVGSDAFARRYAEQLSLILKVPVVVENKPGALATLGTDAVAKAPADGYTVLFSTGNPFTMAPFLLSKLPYNPEKDFVAVTQIYRGGSFLVANKDFPAKSLRELVAMAKHEPGKISFASYGPGSTSHIGFELVQDAAGIELLHVPYKQGAMADVVGGQVMLGWEPPVSALPHIKSGRLKALAYTGSKRSPALPDVPTLAESYPGLEVFSWVGVWVPAATPPAVVQKLYTVIDGITRSAEMQKYIAEAGNDPIGPSPSEATAAIRREAQLMGNLIKAKNIKLD
jgi:tripartite-type tricarboxylate transporter receptor subunit TctC